MRWRKYKADRNESEIVKALQGIPGVTVQTGHDDILVGYQNKTHWFEIKNPEAINKRGQVSKKSGSTAKKQTDLVNTWTGHYHIVSTLGEILEDLGIQT